MGHSAEGPPVYRKPSTTFRSAVSFAHPESSRQRGGQSRSRTLPQTKMPARMMHGDMCWLSYYYRPSPDGSRILFGGRDGTTEGDPLAPTVHLRTELARLFPELANIGITQSWFGYVAMHRDMIPRIFSRGNRLLRLRYRLGTVARQEGGVQGPRRQAAARSAFDLDQAPKDVPFYRGRSWFLPFVYSMYERHDRKTLRRRGDA
jgi:glycine/D-amino acid oxidase-like deaminating enzyme